MQVDGVKSPVFIFLHLNDNNNNNKKTHLFVLEIKVTFTQLPTLAPVLDKVFWRLDSAASLPREEGQVWMWLICRFWLPVL